MIPLPSPTIASVVRGRLLGAGDQQATDVVIDSRAVADGHCFVAIVGPRNDGHRFLADAVAAGARVLLVSRPDVLELLPERDALDLIVVEDTTRALQALAVEIRHRVDPLVVGITGSVGKTTTKSLVADLLRDSAPTHASPGNLNNHWGLPLSLLGLEPGHRWMIAELGMSAAGEIAELAAMAEPRIAVITNIAPVHMENFDSVDGVAAAKAELADALPADGTLIVNADDQRTHAIGATRRDRGGRVLRFGESEDAEVRALTVRAHGSGWSFVLRIGDDEADVALPLPGRHSILNFLAAAAVCHALGEGIGEIAERAAKLGLPAMRGQVHRTGDGVTVIDDSYNASPAAMMRAIDTLVGLAADRKVFVAGGMLELGSWSEEAHREVGLHAAQEGVDVIVTVGSLARDIGMGAEAGGLSSESVHAFLDATEASAGIGDIVRAGDTVLVKGSRGVGTEAIARALLDGPTERVEG